MLRKHVYPVLGSIPFIEVKRPMIRELIAAKKSEGYEQSTIRNIMAPVRGMFFQAMDDEVTEEYGFTISDTRLQACYCRTAKA